MTEKRELLDEKHYLDKLEGNSKIAWGHLTDLERAQLLQLCPVIIHKAMEIEDER